MKRVIEDQEGNLYPVTNLFDTRHIEVDSLLRAETFVAKLDDDNWINEHVGPIVIHTVH